MLFVETSGYQQGRVESHQLSDHVWRLTALRRCGASREMAAVMSGNLLRLIQNLPASSSVTLTWSADSTGGVHLDLTARAVDAQFARDLEWVSGTWHIWEPVTPLPLTRPGTVYEVRPAVLQSPPSNLASLGFASLSGDDAARSTHSKSHAVSGGRLRRARGWPKPALSDATSLMEALHSMSTACESELEEMPAVRIHLAPATEFEAELAEHEFLQTEGRLTPDEADGYLGTPVRMRVLIGVSEEASLPTRLRIALGDWALGDYSTRAIDPAIAGRVWDGIDALAGHAVPEGYAAIFARLLAEKNGDTISTAANTKFADIPAHAWYSGYVKYLSNNGIAYGKSKTIFAPNDAITRAEFTTMAVRFFDVYGDGDAEIMEQFSGFNDVSSGYWAAEYIKYAALHGWINGYGDGSFHADREINRAEVVTIVNRLLGREADEDYIADNLRKLNTFPDVSRKHWAYYAVMEAANTHTAILGDNESWSK